ncbi:MAG: hypothetical protein IJ517_02090 [Alphaproteobacteria bacterium]|nr:hypothetical protein [Alphaproteobacteria bacterium]
MKKHTCDLGGINQDLLMAMVNLDAIVAKSNNAQLCEMVSDVKKRMLKLVGMVDSAELNAVLGQMAQQIDVGNQAQSDKNKTKSYRAYDLIADLEEKFSKIADGNN